MPDIVSFFLHSSSRVIMYETLEISHPSFSKTYRIVRNSRLGLEATLETAETVQFDYYPINITKAGSNGTLDQSFSFSVGDVGNLIGDEIERCIIADTLLTKPIAVYRAFRSDDLTAPMYGPVRLEINDIPATDEGFSLQASPWQPNVNATGEIYTLTRFPGLRGFL